jgi:L-lactate permease
MALFPYLLVIAVFSLAKLVPAVKTWLASTDIKINVAGAWRGRSSTAAGKPNSSAVYNFQWLSSNPGTMLLICSVDRRPRLRRGTRRLGAKVIGGRRPYKMKFSFLTIASVLALAYVMNLSGQTDHDRHLDRRCGRRLRLPVADPRLDRHGRDRLGHQRQRAVRHAAADGRQERRHRPDAARRRQHRPVAS